MQKITNLIKIKLKWLKKKEQKWILKILSNQFNTFKTENIIQSSMRKIQFHVYGVKKKSRKI